MSFAKENHCELIDLYFEKTMEYYQIRESGQDIDFVIAKEDYEQLSYKYPNHVKEIYDDFGVCKYEFEIWKSICLLDYKFLSEETVEEDSFLIISFEKLMVLKVLAMRQPKYLRDMELMIDDFEYVGKCDSECPEGDAERYSVWRRDIGFIEAENIFTFHLDTAD